MVKIQNDEFGIRNGSSIARPSFSVASCRLLQRTTYYRPRTPFFRFLLLFLLSQFIIHNSAFPQQPQAQAGQQIFPVNAKFVQGFGPGYWPTAGSNLTLNLAPGTAVCSNTVQTYAGGTLTLASSATNYVYLNPANNCAPASNTTGFATASIPIATVVTTSTAISSVTDVRTMFVSSGVTNTGTVTSVGMSGDGILFNSAVSGSPVTSSGTLGPQLLTQTAKTVLAGPGSGPAATPTFRALAATDLPASITSSTSGNAATATALATAPTQCGSNNWATGISSSGNANCLQPGFSNLSGTATISQGGTGQTTAATAFNALSPLASEGDLHYYHSSSNSRLAIGGTNTFLTSNGTDPSWGSLTGAGFGSQTANNFLAAPNGTSGNPSFRTLVAADLPASITSNTSGNAATATALATAPSQCTGTAFALGVAASGNANCIGSQTANYVYAAPNGSSGAPTFRALVGSDLPTIAISGGGTGQTTAGAAFNTLSPLSTEGDLLYYHTSTNARLGIGSNGQCLTSNGTDPLWSSCGSGGVSSISGDGNLIANSSSTGAVTLTLGSFSSHYFWGNNTGSSATPVKSLIGTSDTSVNWYAAGSGSAQAQTVTLSPAATALTAGLTVRWKPTAANTGSGPTLAVNGLTATTITKCGATALVANDLTTANLATAVYDGTEFQLLNPMAGACSGVSSFTGDGSLLSNSGSTGGVTATLANAAANSFWGNNTGSTAAPGYKSIGTSDTSTHWYAAGSGSAQAQTVTLSPAATALTAGLTVRWKPTAANTGSGPTLAVNGLTATTITKCGATALVANDLTTANIATAVYDGTEFQLLNPMSVGCGGGGNLSTSGSPAQYQVGVFASGTALAGISPSATSGVPLISQGSSANPIFGTATIAGGGTGQTTASAAFNALSPLTTEGDLHYYHSSSNARLATGSNGQCLTSNGTDPVWGSCSTGSGTVTSVGLSMPSLFSVSGSPVTGSGTLTAALANQNANLIMAGPSSGSAGAPTFRALVGADLPAPTSTTLGGVESLSCTTGQFLNQISTGGVPACATPSGGTGSSGLGNGTTVIDASLQAGADFGLKVNAAIAALPSGGGTVDARGLGGNQSFSENIDLSSTSVTLRLPTGTINTPTCNKILYGVGTNLIGQGWKATNITGNCATPLVDMGTASYGATNVNMSDFSINNSSAAGIALNLPNVLFSTFARMGIAGAYGVVLGGSSGGAYYNSFYDNWIAGGIRALTLSGNANSNEFHGGRFDTEYAGTAVFIQIGAFSNSFYHSDMETDAAGFVDQGQSTGIHDGYFESNGYVTPTWQANTTYNAGQVILDGNSGIELAICTNFAANCPGTSGATAPSSWGTVNGQITVDGTVNWQRLVNTPDIVKEPAGHNEVVDGITNPSIIDLSRDPATLFSTPQFAQFRNLTAGQHTNFGHFSIGGFHTSNLALPAPVLNAVTAGGAATSTYSYALVCKLPGGGVTAVSPFATITNAPNVLGEVEALPVIASSGSGYQAGDTPTIMGGNNDATLTVGTVNGSGAVLTLSAYTPGSGGLGSGEYSTTGGHGSNLYVTVQTNYITIATPSQGNFNSDTNSYPSTQYCAWDFIGRNSGGGSSTAYSVGTGIYWDWGHNSSLPPGIIWDAGLTPASYTAPTRDSTADVNFGSITNNAPTAHVSFNNVQMYGAGGVLNFAPNSQSGNSPIGVNFAPQGTGNESDVYLYFNSDGAWAHQNHLRSTPSGAVLGGLSITTEDEYENPHSVLDDGNGNASFAGTITAGGYYGTITAGARGGFCISGSGCVTSLWSNPMTTLGDLPYGGTSGAATRLAGNTSTTPMYLKSVGSGSAATAPTLAQVQFSDIAGTLGIGAGGTSQTTASAAFNALSPLTTEGDLHYYHSSSNTRLAIGGANTFLTSNGTDPSWGSLTGAGFGSQTANSFLAAPNGSSGNPSFRTLVAADLPASITSNTSGNATTATALAAAPTQCSGNNFATGVAASGNANCSQPALNNLSGSLALSQTPLTTSGDLLYANSTPALARLPIGSANQFLGVSSGSPAWVQPSFSNLSGSVSTSQLPTVPVLNGGTGQTTAAAGFNALSPLTSEGDLHYYHSSSNTRLAVGGANTVLTSNGTDPSWGTVANAALANSSTTVNGQTCTLGSSCTITLSGINPQTSTYQVLASDFSNYKTITVASGTFTITLVANTSQPAAGQYIDVINYGSGVVTIARSGQNINGGATSLTLPASSATAPSYAMIESDGTNYFASLQPTASSLATTVNSQTCTLGSSCSVNNGASQYSVTVNGASGAALGGVSPSSTSGVPLVSQGSSSNPTFGTATVPGGGTGATSFTANSPVAGGTSTTGALQTATAHMMTLPFSCLDSSGSGTAQSCTTTPTFTPAAGDQIIYKTTTTNTGTSGLTINVNSSSAVHVRKWQGTSELASGDLKAGVYIPLTYDGTYWETPTVGNALAAIPYGAGGGTAQAQTVTTTSGAPFSSLTAGAYVSWLPTAANTAAAPTLAVNSLTATSITKCGTTALVASDLLATIPALAVYDGTEFQLLNPSVTSYQCGGTGSASYTSGAWLYFYGGGGKIGGVAPSTAKQIATATVLSGPSFVDLPEVVRSSAATCNNATATTLWALPTSGAPTVACRTGTNTQGGVLQFAHSNTAQFQVDIPGDWDSTSTTYAKIYFTQGSNTTASQTIILQMATGCSSTTDDPSFNTAQAFGTATTTATANTPFTETLSSMTMTSCVAGGNMNVQISRSGSDSATTSPNVYWVSITFPRLITNQAN